MSKSVAEIGRLSASEVCYWLAYSRLDPWDESRADLRAGIAACASLSPWRGADDPPLDPAELMPDYDGTRLERKRRSETEALLRYTQLMKDEE